MDLFYSLIPLIFWPALIIGLVFVFKKVLKKPTGEYKGFYPRDQNGKLINSAFTWMLITTIVSIVAIIPTYGVGVIGLIWCIPMLIIVSKIRDGLLPNTVGFGVCCLCIAGVLPISIIFFTYYWGLSLIFTPIIIPGILLLVAKKDEPKRRKQREFAAMNNSIDTIFQLTDNWDFYIELRKMLLDECDENGQPTNMYHTKKVLFLCMMIEDAGQADMILNFFEEYPAYTNEVVDALFEINAPKSAKLIKEAVELLPEKGTSFFDVATEREWDLIKEINNAFSGYPDGLMRDLYIKYADKHKTEFLGEESIDSCRGTIHE